MQKAGQRRAQKFRQDRSSKSRTNLRKAGRLATLVYYERLKSKRQNFSKGRYGHFVFIKSQMVEEI
jgi:hypothetical protein